MEVAGVEIVDVEVASAPGPGGEGTGPGTAAPDEADRIVRAVERSLREQLGRVERAAASGRRRLGVAGGVAGDLVPAWLRPTVGERRWPAALAVIAMIALQLFIPDELTIPPRWLLPAVELLLLVVLFLANPGRISQQRLELRAVGLSLVALASVANIYSAGRLIWQLVRTHVDDAGLLLTVGGAVWLTNVIIFALWYWEFDRGGPAARALASTRFPDFAFPQMLSPDSAPPDWEPTFTDYFYLSFTNATAFSPTDTMPMTRWAKMTMLLQSAVSLVTVALVIARAVNIFH